MLTTIPNISECRLGRSAALPLVRTFAKPLRPHLSREKVGNGRKGTHGFRKLFRLLIFRLPICCSFSATFLPWRETSLLSCDLVSAPLAPRSRHAATDKLRNAKGESECCQVSAMSSFQTSTKPLEMSDDLQQLNGVSS